jgi:AcrR family transcriptional regulator
LLAAGLCPSRGPEASLHAEIDDTDLRRASQRVQPAVQSEQLFRFDAPTPAVESMTTSRFSDHAPADARPLRADALRNRARILDAAEAVLAEQGLAAPIDDVAREAGVGIGTVYRHFPTKEALFEAVVVNRVQRLVDDAQALAEAGDPGEAFFGFMTRWAEYGANSKALSDGLADTGVDLKAATSDAKQQLRDAVEHLLARAQRAGAVRADVRIDDLWSLLAGVCLAAAHNGYDPTLRARAVAVVCDGLRPSERRLPRPPTKSR